MSQFYVQDPLEKVQYIFDWSDFTVNSLVISSSTWTVPAGFTVSSQTIDGSFTVATVTGGVVGREYKLENTITLSDGQKFIDSIFLYIEEK
jgi:hypothetical protein